MKHGVDVKSNTTTMTSQSNTKKVKPLVNAVTPDTSRQSSSIYTPSRIFGANGPKTSWRGMTDMPADISEFAIDEAVWDDTKGSDIKRHDMDEKIDAFHRALICLGGDVPQKIFGAHALPNLAQMNMERTFMEVFPVVETELKKTPNLQFHTEAATSVEPLFKQVMKGRHGKWIKVIITFVNNSINQNDPDIVMVWIESMEKIIDLLSPKDAAAQILPLAAEKAKSASLISKNASIALLIKLLSHTQADKTSRGKVFETAARILDVTIKDQVPSVRAASVMLTVELIKSTDSSKSADLAKKLLLLADDYDALVRIAVVDGICQILKSGKADLSTQKYFLTTLKKTVRGAYLQKPPQVELLERFSRMMGPVAKSNSIRSLFAEEDTYWFLDAFFCLSMLGLPIASKDIAAEMPLGFTAFRKTLGTTKTPLASLLLSTPMQAVPIAEVSKSSASSSHISQDNNNDKESWMVRANCAANFLDVLKYAKPSITFKDGLHKIFHNFFDDPNPEVRKNICGSLFPVMQEAGKDVILCKDDLIRALSDDNVDVIEAVIPHLSDMLKLLVNNEVLSPEKVTAAAAEIGGVILFCEERLSQTRDWRIHSSLLLQLTVLPFCIPSDVLFQNFVPILLHRLLHLKQLPSRLGAAEALISLLRHARRANQRDEIRRKLKAFAQSTNAQDRMIYLYMSDMIMNRFSRKYYRQHFVEPTLGLAEDKIPNVRTKAYRMLPKVKEKLGNDDVQLLKKLEELVTKIQQSENDRDALEAITVAVEEMARSGVIQNLELHQRRLKEEKDDKRKETEETYIASLESKLPKSNAAKFSLVDKGFDRKASDKTKPTYLPSTLEKPNNLPKLSIAGSTATTSPSSINQPQFRYRQSFPRTSKNIVPLAKKDARLLPGSEGSSRSNATETAVPRVGQNSKKINNK